MTTLFLLFAAVSSALVYTATLRYLRARPPSARTTYRLILGAFLIQSAICVWIGYSLRGLLTP